MLLKSVTYTNMNMNPAKEVDETGGSEEANLSSSGRIRLASVNLLSEYIRYYRYQVLHMAKNFIFQSKSTLSGEIYVLVVR